MVQGACPDTSSRGTVFGRWPDGHRVGTGSSDGTARVWDADTGKHAFPYLDHHAEVLCVAFSPDGRHIVTGAADHTPIVWDASAGRRLLALNGHQAAVVYAGFSQGGSLVVTASAKGRFKFWDAQTGRCVQTEWI